MQTVYIRLGQLERDIEERPLKQQQDMATTVSPIAVAKAVVKIDIRLLVSNKIDQTSLTHRQTGNSSSRFLESANIDLRSQNR